MLVTLSACQGYTNPIISLDNKFVDLRIKVLSADVEEQDLDNLIDDVIVLVFRNKRLDQVVSAHKINFNQLHFKVSQSELRTELHFLVNTQWELDTLYEHMGKPIESIPSILPKIPYQLTLQNLPMWGFYVLTNGTRVDMDLSSKTIRLMRAVSKVNLSFGQELDKSRFEPSSIQVFRGSELQVIPDFENLNKADFRVDKPSSTYYQSEDCLKSTKPISIKSLSQSLTFYISESCGVDQSDPLWFKQTAVLVLGGYYKEDTRETFYRIDSKREEDNDMLVIGEFLRNHFYGFRIDNITSRGAVTPQEAAMMDGIKKPNLVVTGWIPTNWSAECLGGTYDQTYQVLDWVIAQSDVNFSSGTSTVTPWSKVDWDLVLGSEGYDNMEPWKKLMVDLSLGKGDNSIIYPWIQDDYSPVETQLGDKDTDFIKPWEGDTQQDSEELGAEYLN